jgi:ATP-dependent Clp protease ATP-binding subunit ClpB
MASSIEIPARRLSKNPLIGAPANSDKPLPNTAVNGLNSIKFIRQFSGLNNSGVGAAAQRQFHSTPHSQYSAGSAAQINQSEFTDMAWEAIVGSVDAARQSKQQVVETEHLMKALLEQKNGLARRIFTKAGLDNTSVLQATEQFISQLPKVTGDTTGPLVSPNVTALLDQARNHKKEFGDDFLSVEHMVLAFLKDKRFGQKNI